MRTKTDAELLKDFVETNDQDAFSEIVSRHGSMVYRACFRKLGNVHDAEDASQAVFMALIKKSNRIAWRYSLASWLFAVARQTALYMARTRANCEKRETAAAEIMDTEIEPLFTKDDQKAVLSCLNEEISTLTAVQREAVILRYLEGLGEKEASVIAGCSYNAFRSRVSDGIRNLRNKMARSGCAIATPALIALLSAESHASIPQTLIPSLLAVPKLAAAGAKAGAASANIIVIMEGVMKTMAISKIKTFGLGIILFLLIGGTGVLAVRKIQKKQNLGAIDKNAINNSNLIIKSNNGENIQTLAKSTKNTELASKKKILLPKKQRIRRNFQAALEIILNEKVFDKSAFSKVLKQWFEKDQDAAVKWGEKNVPNYQFAIMIFSVVWAETDPLAAAEWAVKLEESARLRALPSIFIVWGRQEPFAAADWALNLPKEPESIRESAMDHIVQIWTQLDPAIAKTWILKLPKEDRTKILKTYESFLASQGMDDEEQELLGNELEKETTRIMQITDKTKRFLELTKFTCNLAEENFETAAKWAMRLPDKKSKNTALTTIFSLCGEKDIAKMLKWAEAIREKDDKNGFLSIVAEKVAEKDIYMAIGWVDTFQNEKFRNQVLERVIAIWAKRKPVLAANYAEELPEGNVRDKALPLIAGKWGSHDHSAAAEWVLGFPDGKIKERALEQLGFGWACGIFGTKRKHDPIGAAEWAVELPDTQHRYCALLGVFQFWGEYNPSKAKEWLEQSSLSLDEKDKLLKVIERKR